MNVTRRTLIKAGMAAGTALTIPSILRAQTPSVDGTVRMVMFEPTIFDPLLSVTSMTYMHAMAVYDTLFAFNSKLVSQPQMVSKWGLSDDKKTYTFELRDGLKFHDGSTVTATDCVESIRRWTQVDAGGKLIMERASDIAKTDEKTFKIALKEPLGNLVDSLAGGLNFLAIMRAQDASRPATEPVNTNIGSGPFKFNQALAKPGVSFTYDRNESYVPRKDAQDGLAGAKVVKIDRAVWQFISDQQTAVAALQAGEIDFYEEPPADLYPVIESDTNLELEVLKTGGSVVYLRLNFLQPPFNNVKARQAMLHLVDQEALLSVIAPDLKYARPVTSIFGNSSPYSNDENTGWYKKGGDPEKAKQLFQEAGYSGETVFIFQPTDWPVGNNVAQLVADALRKIGINVELSPMAWAEFTTRRTNKGPVEDGGWSIFVSDWPDFNLRDPIGTAFLHASGDQAWWGWPKNDEYEALRAKWVDLDTVGERQALARKMQGLWWDFVGAVMVGQVVAPTAHRKSLTGLIPVPNFCFPMWNMQKAES